MDSRPATTSPIDRTLDVAGKVRVQQMRTLFEGGPVATIAATYFAFAMAFNMRGEVSDAALMAWLALKCAVAVPRIVHTMLFARRSKDELRWRLLTM